MRQLSILNALNRSQRNLETPELRAPSSTTSSLREAGFTLIELIATIVVIAVLAAIVAPAWLGFLEQRRATSVRDEVFLILQNARDEARNAKLSRTVEFIEDPPQYRISGAGLPLTTPFQDLGGSFLEIEPGQVALSTTLNSVTFNYLGEVDEDIQVGFTVTASAPGATGDATKRCVEVKTLLGAIAQESGTDCN